MFERFTERARQVVVIAQDEARALKHNSIGTEHLLLGLLGEAEGMAAAVLGHLGIDMNEVRFQVKSIVPAGEQVTVGLIPFTPRAKKVLELALREALSLGHNYVATQHVLLGLVRESEGVAARILADYDATPETVRAEIVRRLSGSRGAVTAPPDPVKVYQAALADALTALRAFCHEADAEEIEARHGITYTPPSQPQARLT